MTFSEMIKSDADQKYLQLLDDNAEPPIKKPDINSCAEYIEKRKILGQRIEQEEIEVKEALKTIRETRAAREKKMKEELKALKAKTAAQKKKEQGVNGAAPEKNAKETGKVTVKERGNPLWLLCVLLIVGIVILFFVLKLIIQNIVVVLIIAAIVVAVFILFKLFKK